MRGSPCAALCVVILLACCRRDEETPRCIPGATAQCVCIDGTGQRGAQTCGHDGTFGACACASTAPAEMADPPKPEPASAGATLPNPAPTPFPSVRPHAPAAPVAIRPRGPALPPPPPTGASVAADDNNGRTTPMQRVQQCRQSDTGESVRNNCIIDALRGRANSMQELGMLATTYQAMGRTEDATSTMGTYIQRYPGGPLVVPFTRYRAEH